MLHDGITDKLKLHRDSHLFKCLQLCEMVGLVFVLHIEITLVQESWKSHKIQLTWWWCSRFAGYIWQLV